MKKEVYKKILLSVIAKNLNRKILTRISLLLKDGMGVKDGKQLIVYWFTGMVVTKKKQCKKEGNTLSVDY